MNKFIIALLVIVVWSACGKKSQVNDDPIPDVPVSFTVNMALPLNSHLFSQGTHLYYDAGVKGVVVVHHTDDNFYAFDRNCSFKPSQTCSRIEVDSSFNLFRCGESTISGFVKCCDSKFDMNGEVFNGPATFGLKHYQVLRSGNILNIKN